MENVSSSKINAGEQKKYTISRQDINTVLIAIFGFFIGRVILFQIINPVAVGFLANFLLFNPSPVFYISSVFVLFGIFTKLSGLYFIKYFITIASMALVNIILTKKRYKPSILVKAGICSSFTLLSGILFSVLNEVSIYFMLMAVLEAILTFFLSIVLKKSVNFITGHMRKKSLTNEDILSIALLFGSVVAGCADITFSGVSLRVFAVTMLLLFVAYKGGCALAALSSVLLGFMLYVVGYSESSSILIFSVAAISAGILKERGKITAVGGFLIGGACATFFFEPSLPSRGYLISVISGIIGFLLIPAQIYLTINTSINPTVNNAEEYILRVKEITTNRLISFSNAFAKLAKTFVSLSQIKPENHQINTTKLIDDICEQACSKCSKQAHCWEDNAYETFQTIYGMLSACEKKGKIEMSDIPINFINSCVNFKQFTDRANRLYEINKLDAMWNNRLAESRELVSQQLKGVSGIIKNLSEELDLHVCFKDDLETGIMTELIKNRIEVDSVIVLENKIGKYEVTVNHPSCLGKKSCLKEIGPIISRVLGVKMKPVIPECITRKGACVLQLSEEQTFRISSGVSRLVKTGSKQSGDSYSFMRLKNGQCLLALSDGMGSGDKAKEESTAAIELLEDFIESGFEKEMAIKMINSALVLKSSDESFSTLDICGVNLYSGEAEFIKIGAATTFIVRNGAVSLITSRSLPIGILSNVDLETNNRTLKNGDIIVMTTDGLLNTPDKGEWVIEALSNFKGLNPQDISDYLLAEAERRSNGVISDDITVLVAKIWEKRSNNNK